MGKKAAEKTASDNTAAETGIDQSAAAEAGSPPETAVGGSKNHEKPAPKEPELDKPVVRDAIAAGKRVLAEGGTKADAARAMYETISGETKETIVAAFVAGATLTEKGALTYWYNCKRKASKKPAPPTA